MSNISRYVIHAFGWSVLSKLLDASIKFISVPLLLNYFGKTQYGLITLSISINAYLQLLDMGVNTGAIRFFSEWITSNKKDLLDSVARTSITFYGIIGLVNTVSLIIFSYIGINFFKLTSDQANIFRNLIVILAIFPIINWSTSVFNQLIIANSKISYIQKVNIVKSVINLILIWLTIKLSLSIYNYFFLFCLLNSLVVIPFYLKAHSDKLISNFSPKRDWINFKIVLKYSSAILLMAIFQMSAVKLRPIILGIFSDEGISSVTDFRIMESITAFVISMGSMSSTIFLPKASKLLSENDATKVKSFAYQGTKFTSTVCAILCFPFILCTTEILTLYVGKEYNYLSTWLSIWLITILFFLHNGPIASLVLASRKVNKLVYSTGLACIISLIINATLCKSIGVGGAILGFSTYILIQISFYYLYFNSKVLKIESKKVFKSFIVPMLLATTAAFITLFIFSKISFFDYYSQIIFKSMIWLFLFTILIFSTRFFTIEEVRAYLKRT